MVKKWKIMICVKDKHEVNCIGEAFIHLDSFDLSQQSISWYKLYKQNMVQIDDA